MVGGRNALARPRRTTHSWQLLVCTPTNLWKAIWAFGMELRSKTLPRAPASSHETQHPTPPHRIPTQLNPSPNRAPLCCLTQPLHPRCPIPWQP